MTDHYGIIRRNAWLEASELATREAERIDAEADNAHGYPHIRELRIQADTLAEFADLLKRKADGDQ